MAKTLISSQWESFWFVEIDARQFAVLRIGFGAISAAYLYQLLPFDYSQFSQSGWLGNSRQIAEFNGGNWSLLFLPTTIESTLFARLIFIVCIVSSVLLMLGWHSRLQAALCWLIWVSLWNRNPLILDGDDALIKLMCFYLMLSPCGNRWSIDAYRKHLPTTAVAWPLRLIQFQIALLYFVSGWVKFHSGEWLDGAILQYTIIHPHYSRWDGWPLLEYPLVLSAMTIIADIIRWWELLFPILLLHPVSRKFSIAVGILFHLGLLLTMNLRGFAIIMLVLYPALLTNDEFQRMMADCRNLFKARIFWFWSR